MCCLQGLSHQHKRCILAFGNGRYNGFDPQGFDGPNYVYSEAELMVLNSVEALERLVRAPSQHTICQITWLDRSVV